MPMSRDHQTNLGGVHILRRQLGGREVFAKSLRLSTRGREGYSKCLRSFLRHVFQNFFAVTSEFRPNSN